MPAGSPQQPGRPPEPRQAHKPRMVPAPVSASGVWVTNVLPAVGARAVPYNSIRLGPRVWPAGCCPAAACRKAGRQQPDTSARRDSTTAPTMVKQATPVAACRRRPGKEAGERIESSPSAPPMADRGPDRRATSDPQRGRVAQCADATDAPGFR